MNFNINCDIPGFIFKIIISFGSFFFTPSGEQITTLQSPEKLLHRYVHRSGYVIGMQQTPQAKPVAKWMILSGHHGEPCCSVETDSQIFISFVLAARPSPVSCWTPWRPDR